MPRTTILFETFIPQIWNLTDDRRKKSARIATDNDMHFTDEQIDDFLRRRRSSNVTAVQVRHI